MATSRLQGPLRDSHQTWRKLRSRMPKQRRQTASACAEEAQLVMDACPCKGCHKQQRLGDLASAASEHPDSSRTPASKNSKMLASLPILSFSQTARVQSPPRSRAACALLHGLGNSTNGERSREHVQVTAKRGGVSQDLLPQSGHGKLRESSRASTSIIDRQMLKPRLLAEPNWGGVL